MEKNNNNNKTNKQQSEKTYANAVATNETVASTIGQREIGVGDERLFAGVKRKVLQLDVAHAADDARAHKLGRYNRCVREETR